MNSDGTIVSIGNGGSFGNLGVFKWSGTSWDIIGDYLVNEYSDGSTDDFFGNVNEISDDGKVIVIGSQNDDVIGNNGGRTFVYEYDGQNWQKKKEIDGTEAGTNMPEDVAISGNGTRISLAHRWFDYSNGTGKIFIYDVAGRII